MSIKCKHTHSPVFHWHSYAAPRCGTRVLSCSSDGRRWYDQMEGQETRRHEYELYRGLTAWTESVCVSVIEDVIECLKELTKSVIRG